MANRTDTFAIGSFARFYLVLNVLVPLGLLIFLATMLSGSSLKLDPTWGPIGIIVMIGWIGHGFYLIAKWFNYRLEVGDDAVCAGDIKIAWSDVASASVKTAFKFDPYIKINDAQGKTLVVPAAVQQNSLVLSIVERHFPGIVREG